MITCRELVDFLMAYLDGELPAEQRASFEAHLQACPQCEDYLESYRTTVALGQSLRCGAEDVPSEVPEALVRAVLAARKKT